MKFNIFVQARMSSKRFPGKMLAPLKDKPLIQTVLDNLKGLRNKHDVVVLTSTHRTDDPLCAYLHTIRQKFFRGSLNHVFLRFRNALKTYPCDYCVRISGDSPHIHAELIDFMIQQAKSSNADFITNIHPRSFPKGQSIEIIKTALFQKINETLLTEDEKEHVTPYFYRNMDRYTFTCVEHTPSLSNINQCVDTVEDLHTCSSNQHTYQFDESKICLKIP